MDNFLNTVWCTLKPSSIHGVGVFALRDTPAGTQVIWQYDTVEAPTLTETEFQSLPVEIAEEILARTIFIEGEPLTFLDPNSTTNYRSYMNHSDTPNTDGLKAMRDIAKGEELTEDYKTMGNWHRLTQDFMNNVV